MEWWEELYGFFGEFYHHGDHSNEGYDANKRLSFLQRTDNEINWILSYLNPKQGSSFLDCPCGSGRHNIALANKGFEVTGVDINSKMLSYKTDYHGFKEGNPNFLQMDRVYDKIPH
jgi:ubiquinone/menaquinone biosynthesis C-methylase UbiE